MNDDVTGSPDEIKGTGGYALDQIIEQAENGHPWVFTRDGKPVAIVIGYTEFEQMKEALVRAGNRGLA